VIRKSSLDTETTFW